MTDIALLLRRAALAQAPEVPDTHDLLGWAELCFASGEADAARLLYAVAFIRQGFSPQHRLGRRAIIARTRLWDGDCAATSTEPQVATSTADIALGELRSLAARLSPGAAAIPPTPTPIHDETEDLADLVHALHRLLGGGHDGGDEEAETLLLRLNVAARRGALLDYRTFGMAPLPVLAAALAYAGLNAFLIENGDLALAPFGSAALLRATASFDNAGLGPYLRNVRSIVRRSRDVFELARVAQTAARAAGGEDRGLAPWLILLTLHLRDGLLVEVVDDLGDLGAMDVLVAMYERIARCPPALVDLSMIRRMRDIALDNLDYDFAARTQALVVRLHPDNLLERTILGTIEGSGGLVAAAEQTFLACLARAPGDGDIARRLLALRQGAFASYAIDRGFASPPDRVPTRLRRRSGAIVHREQKKRPLAVEL